MKTATKKRKRPVKPEDVVLTPEEQELEDSFQGTADDLPLERERMQAAARETLKKDARVSFRISSSTLSGIKMRAARDGLPYQTLMASVLHRYVTGRLTDHS